MAGQLKLRRGTTSQLANFIGAEGELTYNTTLRSLVLHDGVTLGGVKIPYLSNDLVPSTMLPTATESVIGASKIATTAIAQGGTNDADIITAKKLRDALNASGEAPISACRAWAIYSTTTNTFVGQMNVASITMTGGRVIVVLQKPMPSSTYLVLADRFAGTSGTATQGSLIKRDPTYAQTETTFQLVQYSTADGSVSSSTGTISFVVF